MNIKSKITSRLVPWNNKFQRVKRPISDIFKFGKKWEIFK